MVNSERERERERERKACIKRQNKLYAGPFSHHIIFTFNLQITVNVSY